MANTREITKRRKSITNISKLTKTMEMIASARFKKAHDRAVQSRAFTDKIVQLSATMANRVTNVHHPLLQQNNEAHKVILLVLSSNRGLCGGYNSHVLHLAHREIASLKQQGCEIELRVVGKKGIGHFNFIGMKPATQYNQFDKDIDQAAILKLADEFIELYSSKQIDAVYVVYTHFYSVAMFRAQTEQLLPISFSEDASQQVGSAGRMQPVAGSGTGASDPLDRIKLLAGAGGDYIFSPEPEKILSQLIPAALQSDLFQCFADAVVCEQVARMRAMKAASDNARQVIRNLASQYNRARQSQITGELLDIIGGSEALK